MKRFAMLVLLTILTILPLRCAAAETIEDTLRNTLTPAGIALCRSLTTEEPTYRLCQNLFLRMQPPCDYTMTCPAAFVSSPDNQWDAKRDEHDRTCTAVATYAMSDGSTGTEHFCVQSARLYWIPGTLLWRWKLE